MLCAYGKTLKFIPTLDLWREQEGGREWNGGIEWKRRGRRRGVRENNQICNVEQKPMEGGTPTAHPTYANGNSVQCRLTELSEYSNILKDMTQHPRLVLATLSTTLSTNTSSSKSDKTPPSAIAIFLFHFYSASA